jgi:hypothetical protein
MLGTGDPDMLATIDAEDTFDLTHRLGSITNPALGALLDAGATGDQIEASRVQSGAAAEAPGHERGRDHGAFVELGQGRRQDHR